MEGSEKKQKKFFDTSLILKIVSLLCAILLWFYVSEVESPTSEKKIEAVAVTLRNKDIMTSETGLSVLSDTLYDTNIVLSGKKSTLNKINYEDITATVDLSKLTEPGTYELPISVVAPQGTSLVSTNPRFITVSVDKTVALPFNVETILSYSTTYEMGECTITDAQARPISAVTVSGPASDIERVDKVVAKADFGTITSSVKAKTNLVCLDINGDEITNSSIKLTPDSVIINQPVYMTKNLPLKAVQAQNTFANNQISFNVKPSSVEVKGDPKVLRELTEITLDPIDEQSVIGEGLINTVNSLIKLPEEVELIGMQNTATITVSVKNVKKHYLTITPENLKITGLPSNLAIEFEDESWQFLIINASDKELTVDDLDLTLDLSLFVSAGKYKDAVTLSPKFKENLSYAYITDNKSRTISFSLVEKDESEETVKTEEGDKQ